MQRVRVGESAADELEDLVKTCIRELEISGVYGSVDDPTYFQAIVLYCKANYEGIRNNEKLAYLEYGTSKQEARPVIGKAVHHSENECLQIMQEKFNEVVGK